MKVGDKKKDLQLGSVRILDNSSGGGDQTLIQGARVAPDNQSNDQVQLDTARSIGDLLDPSKVEAERRAKVDDIKKRYQAGKYVQPTSDVLAKKVAEEVNIEILSGSQQDATTLAE